MKNKVITIVCVILAFAAIGCFGYIFLNSNNEEPVVENNNNNNQQQEEPVQEEEPINREEKGQNIVVTSRIGVLLTEQIKYSDLYSNMIIEEMDINGLSSKAKILVAIDKTYRKQEYQQYRQDAEDYSSTYITSANMNKIINDTFLNTSVENINIDGVVEYDAQTQNFTLLSMGFQAGILNYTVEIPYKITEYADRIELLAYRVYITKTVEMVDIETTVKNEVYYDKAKSILALTETDDSIFNEDYIKNKINDRTIDANNLEEVQYTFKQDDSSYKIDSFKKI